jgi:hypothetical protein
MPAGETPMPVHMPAVCHPSSAAFMETCHQYSTGGMSAKYQHDTRKMPASCQDWGGRLCYSPCAIDHVGMTMVLWAGCRRARFMWRTACDMGQIRAETDVVFVRTMQSSEA